MITSSRRTFLKYSLATLGLMAADGWQRHALGISAASASPTTPPGREIIASCSHDEFAPGSDETHKVKLLYPKNGMLVARTWPGTINFYDVAANQSFAVNVPIFGHAILQDPANKQRVVTFEKWGLRGAAVDMASREMITELAAVDGNTFFGHGAFIQDGNALVTTEDNLDRTNGQLVIRDPNSYKPLQCLSSYGAMPHDCRSVDGGKTLIAMNESYRDGQSSMTWVDTASGKLLHKIPTHTETGSLFAHMAFADDGWMCVGGINKAPATYDLRYAPVALISPDGKVFPLEAPLVRTETGSIKHTEGLSISFLKGSDYVAATLPEYDGIYVWNYKTREFVGLVRLAFPGGLIQMLPETKQPVFLAISRGARNLMQFSMDGSQFTGTEKIAGFGAGPHMIRMYI